MKSSSKSLIIFVSVYALWIFLFGKKESLDFADLDLVKRRAEKFEMKLGDQRQRLDHLEQEVRQLSKGRVKVSKEWKEPIPVLVFACNRPLAVRDHVQKLIKYRPNKELFPIFVSQDCDNEDVRNKVMEFGDKVNYIKHVSGDNVKMTMPEAYRYGSAYYKIARHYKLALDHIFIEKNYTSVIITEDDLDIAADFFPYFSSTRYLLEVDPKLWCVTAWNDNGKSETIDINAPEKLYRSDFMAGLGWMTTREVWEELGPIWPSGFWDDWMREPVQRKGRQCIRPEVSRTGMMQYGMKGVSRGLFFTEHLIKVRVNEKFTDFGKLDLDYLLPGNYRRKIDREVMEEAEEIEFDKVATYVLKPENKDKSVRVMYTGNIDFVEKAEKLGIMNDFKAGVPRTAYDGIVTCFINGIRIYLVPDRSKTQPYA